MTKITLDTLCCTVNLSSSKLDEIKPNFKTVHFHPDKNIPKDVLADIDVWFTHGTGIPGDITDIEAIPRTKLIQITSAGANNTLKMPVLKTDKAKKQISISSASGIHSFSIPQFIIAHIVNVYRNHQLQMFLCRKNAHWPDTAELEKHAEAERLNANSSSLHGKTAGMLGYGHIGRETARLLKALNCDVIAANSSGTKREDDGYIIPGTGDADGSIPSAYYATTDDESFKKFISRCDILVASLPSTQATHFLLKAEHFKVMKKGAVLVNVGRGDLAHSDDILAALDSHDGLYGAALDVTDPEPLPDGHPLFTHPRVIITPHTSGDFDGYMNAAADLLVANVKRVREGHKPFNVVDPKKGY